MCCFPLCIVSAPTTRSMHPVCMYVYTLSIYICIYIYIYYYDYYDTYIYIHVYINMPICLQVHQYMHIWKILKNTLCGYKLQLDVENYPSYNVCVCLCSDTSNHPWSAWVGLRGKSQLQLCGWTSSLGGNPYFSDPPHPIISDLATPNVLKGSQLRCCPCQRQCWS